MIRKGACSQLSIMNKGRPVLTEILFVITSGNLFSSSTFESFNMLNEKMFVFQFALSLKNAPSA